MHGQFSEELGSAGKEFASLLRDIEAKRLEDEKWTKQSKWTVFKRNYIYIFFK